MDVDGEFLQVIRKRLLDVEQPFPYDLEEFPIDVHSVSQRKPLFLDESAHDWRFVRLGRELGWTGVALKTCKTLTGALLSLAWARANNDAVMAGAFGAGMFECVQSWPFDVQA